MFQRRTDRLACRNKSAHAKSRPRQDHRNWLLVNGSASSNLYRVLRGRGPKGGGMRYGVPSRKRYYRPHSVRRPFEPVDAPVGLAPRLLACGLIGFVVALFMLGYGQLKAQNGFYLPSSAPTVSRHIRNSVAEAPAPDMDSPLVKFANADVSSVLPPKQNEDSSNGHKGRQNAAVATRVAKKNHRVAHRRYERAMRSYAWAPWITQFTD